MSQVQAVPVAAPRFAEFIAMMAALMALTALSIDIMLPALPQIRDEFGLTSANQQQLVVTLYVLGFALGQLFQGPLSDRFGRRPVLFVGLAVYAVASFACLVAGSFDALLVARFVQGAANAGPRVIAVAIVRDLYGGRRMAEVMSFIMTVFIIVPIVAPTIGSGLMLLGSWHVIFAFLLLVSLATLGWMAARLPETRPADEREPLSLAWIGAALREIVGNRQTLGYSLAIGTAFGAMMGYVNSAQQIFVEAYAVGSLFTLVFGSVAAALAIASFVNSQLVLKLGMRRVSHAALLGFAGIGVLHLGLQAGLGQLTLGLFLGLMALQLFCFGLLMPNFNALAMEPMGRIAGTASSFVGALTTGLAAAIGWYIGQHYDGTVIPLLAGFAVVGVLSLAIVLVTERGRLFRAGL